MSTTMQASDIQLKNEGFSAMPTPELVDQLRGLWRGQIYESVKENDEEKAQVFDVALTAVLSRVIGYAELSGQPVGHNSQSQSRSSR